MASQLAWVSGKAYGWSLSYDGKGNGGFDVKDGATLLLAQTYTAAKAKSSDDSAKMKPLRSGNALKFSAAAKAGLGSAKIEAAITQINGSPVNGKVATAGNNLAGQAQQFFYSPALMQGLRVDGLITLSFSGSAPPVGNNLNFFAASGNLACVGP